MRTIIAFDRSAAPFDVVDGIEREVTSVCSGPDGVATREVTRALVQEPGVRAFGLDAPIVAAAHRLVRAGESVPAGELASALVDLGASGAAVVDASGSLIGVVTKSDVARAGADGNPTVGDAMTPSHLSLPPTAKLGEAVALMAWKGVHRVPIVTATGEVLGVIGAIDVIRWMDPARGRRETG